MNDNLRRVRRTNFWRSRWADTYSIMDEISALFIWLRRQENGESRNINIIFFINI